MNGGEDGLDPVDENRFPQMREPLFSDLSSREIINDAITKAQGISGTVRKSWKCPFCDHGFMYGATDADVAEMAANSHLNRQHKWRGGWLKFGYDDEAQAQADKKVCGGGGTMTGELPVIRHKGNDYFFDEQRKELHDVNGYWDHVFLSDKEAEMIRNMLDWRER